MEYWVLAYYLFTPIEDPAREVLCHKDFFNSRDIKGRIYISHEGINGQMSASSSAAEEYMAWLKSDPRFAKISFKVHYYSEHCFPRATVKVRSQLVAMDRQVDMNKTATHVDAATWRKILEQKNERTVVLDVRNTYESEIGHFEGAICPSLEQFREFPKYVQQMKEKWDPKTVQVMMYCTGGIRCEVYSALLKEEGFQEVVQLEGGVVQYGLDEGAAHWKGKLFVFDDRLAVPLSQDASEVISLCRHCKAPSDIYFNCANMDCNELFTSCLSCAETQKGCCCETCQVAPRLRPFEKTDRPKPFRRCLKK